MIDFIFAQIVNLITRKKLTINQNTFGRQPAMINIRIDFKLQIDEKKFDRWCKIRGVGRNFARNYIKEQIENKTNKYIKENDLK